jgi:hypothetical protein
MWGSVSYAGALRQEIAARNREWAQSAIHVESYGGDPVVVYAPCEGMHGNFYEPAYASILSRPEWARRFEKVHTGARGLPKNADEPARKWRELDSCMSSDALLMNIFCTPGVSDSPAVRRMSGVNTTGIPQFGWKAKVPLNNGRFDRTEVDMRWGDLLVEAKLTEADFQTRAATIVENYRDFDTVFDRELLPRTAIRLSRRKDALEFPEGFTQEWEQPDEDNAAIAAEFQAGIAVRVDQSAPVEHGYASYQLIRNVLAAHSAGCRFCVLHDERRPDLREQWFSVMRAIRDAELRTRCQVLTWQELAPALPEGLQLFLAVKYGIGVADRSAGSSEAGE